MYFIYYFQKKKEPTHNYSTGYDLSHGKEIVMLCFLSNRIDATYSIKCLNREENYFEEYPVFPKGLEDLVRKSDSTIDRGLITLVELDADSNTISEYMDDINYEQELISILDRTEVDDYIIAQNEEENVLYIDLYDYLKTKVALMKYCEENKCQEDYRENSIEQIEKTLTFYCSSSEDCSRNLFLYPADRADIDYLRKFNEDLGEAIEKESNILLDYFYQNSVYFLERGDFANKDLGIYPNFFESINGLYKVDKFVEGSSEVSEKYIEFFNKYRSILLSNSGVSLDMSEVLSTYLPLVNQDILYYFKELYETNELERFKTELEMLFYYLYFDDETLKDTYKIINLLFNEI
jgi:hypothetical protein